MTRTYGFSIHFGTDFDHALDLLARELKKQGFGIVTDINMQAIFNEKLAVDEGRYRILGVCNPWVSHQRAVLEGNVGTAVAALKTFDDELWEHIDYEEKTLLPLFAQEGGETEGATLKIFQAEHRKLREQADRLTKKTQALFASSDLT